jgi:DNA-binding NarL/FixJ family response regulator
MWVLTRMLTKTIPHTFIRNGYYYFSRRVPSDLRDHYSYHRIVQGLRTTSPQKAKVQASLTSAKLEAYWNQVRLAKSDVIGMSLVRDTSSDSGVYKNRKRKPVIERDEVRKLKAEGLSTYKIAEQMSISRMSVHRILNNAA